MEITSTPFLSLMDIDNNSTDLYEDAWGLRAILDSCLMEYDSGAPIPDEELLEKLFIKADLKDLKKGVSKE